ncbi:DUF4395 family protein [Spirillospora sp. NPDC049652]
MRFPLVRTGLPAARTASAGPSREPEPRSPPRSTRGTGRVFTLVGTVGFVAGPLWPAIAGPPRSALGATALALAAAFLNPAFGPCPGCEPYPPIRRPL